MTVKIKQLEKKDFNQARQYAIKGMNLDRYTRNKLELYLYSQYFWNSEINQATRAYGAYINDQLVGTMLVRMQGERAPFKSKWRTCLSNLVQFTLDKFYTSMTSKYDQANLAMLTAFAKDSSPDGEILFFAVNPEITSKGIGTRLMNELIKDEVGKLIYLYTDSGCTYQFYQHRGFNKAGERKIIMKRENKEIPLTCFLFTKQL